MANNVIQLRGMQFGDYQTADDWGLILNEKHIEPPKPKENYVSVPGRDGDLDLTPALTGEVNYENRSAAFRFLLTDGTHADRDELITEILGALHGKSLQIIDTDDYPNYYLNGRLTVTNTENNAGYGVVEIEANCEPWRWAINETTRNVTVTENDGTITVIITNHGYKTLTPTIVTTGSITLTFGTTSVVLSAGSTIIPGFQLAPGANTFTVAGTGTIAITYREAIF